MEDPSLSAISSPSTTSGSSTTTGPSTTLTPSTTPGLSEAPRPSSSCYSAAELMQIKRLADDDDATDIDSEEEFYDPDRINDSEDTLPHSSDSSDSEDDTASRCPPVGQDDEWTLQRFSPRGPPLIPFCGQEEIHIRNAKTPFDFFNILFDGVLEQIVASTNECASQLLQQCSTSQAVTQRWKPLTVPNLRIFLAIMLHMGDVKMNTFSEYWREHQLYNMFASKFMTRNTFLLILKCLRFGQNNLYSLIAYFNDKMAELHHPGEQLVIDESVTLIHGRTEISQYKGKSQKSGIKLYKLATPIGIVHKILLSKGKRDEKLGGKDHTNKVVVELLEKYFGTGRHVYMNNVFNSVGLSEYLLSNGVNVTGTLKANREGNPGIVARNLIRGGSVFRYNNSGICICKWRGNRDVLTISTAHSPGLKQVQNRRGKVILKPEMVLEYLKFMNGADKQDQMLEHYSCEHKTLRWYKKLGIHILQMMMQNAFFLYKVKMEKEIDFCKFREKVITQLLPRPAIEVRQDLYPKIKMENL